MSKYRDLKKYPTSKKKDKYCQDYDTFSNECARIFDIIGANERIVLQEKIWGVKMSKSNKSFYENQCLVPQVGCSTNFVDRKWEKTQKRKCDRHEKEEKKRKNTW